MKKGEILIAPEGCEDWLTPFKEYEVKSLLDNGIGRYGHSFKIKCDDFGNIRCLEKECSHLNGQDWIIKSEAETEWNELNGLIQLTDEQAKRKEYLIKCLKK